MPEDVIDLAHVTGVDETDSGRSYGFQVIENNETGGVKRHSLAALTSGIRSQWIQVLRNACNQGTPAKSFSNRDFHSYFIPFYT